MDPTSESDREATAPPVRSTPRPSLQPMLPLPLLCLLALLLAPMGEARYLLVGNYSSADNSWSQFTDYGQWEKENPLYVGDVVIFRYLKYQSVVWRLPNLKAWEHCQYDEAEVLGNDTAGTGVGLPYTVTSKPAYFAAGVFGECEEFAQKVILQGTLGPLPTSPRTAPAQIPDPFRSFPRPPPPRPPPPSPRPPPPLFKGSLYKVFSSRAARKQFSAFYALLSPLAKDLEGSLSARQNLTVLAPTNAALRAHARALEVALSLLPTSEAKAQFLTSLLKFHVVTEYVTAQSLPALAKKRLHSLQGQPLTLRKRTFVGSPGKAYGQGTIVALDLQDAKGAGPPTSRRKIAVQGINGVLFPANLTSLIPTKLLSAIKFGTDPPLPVVKQTREVKKELALVASSAYSSLKGLFFSNFSAILEGPPSLWPSLAAMGGATVLVPTDYAWAHPQWLLTAALVKGALKGPSFRPWLRNVALFHVLRIFKSSIDWTSAAAYTGTPTALPSTVLFSISRDGIPAFFADKANPSLNASVDNFRDLQAPSDYLISIQGVNRVLLPFNVSRLLPPSAVPASAA